MSVNLGQHDGGLRTTGMFFPSFIQSVKNGTLSILVPNGKQIGEDEFLKYFVSPGLHPSMTPRANMNTVGAITKTVIRIRHTMIIFFTAYPLR